MNSRLVHLDHEGDSPRSIISSRGGVATLMILLAAVGKRFGEFQCNVLTDWQSQQTVGSIGQSECEPRSVVAYGFLSYEWQGGEFDFVKGGLFLGAGQEDEDDDGCYGDCCHGRN